MPTYALTGELASGKTTVLGLLRKHGAIIFNADERVHQFYNNKKSRVYAQVIAAFPHVVQSGKISCARLAATVFAKKELLQRLEDIVHPAVTEDLTQWLKTSARQKSRVYIAEIPLLFEKKLDRLFDKTIVIRVKHQVLIPRIQKKYKYTACQARARLALFMPMGKKVTRADFVIDNSARRADLEKEVFLLWHSLKNNCK